VFEIGTGVRSLGDTTGATVAVPHVLGYTSRSRHQTPPLCWGRGIDGIALSGSTIAVAGGVNAVCAF
jgi:hypothetical protein